MKTCPKCKTTSIPEDAKFCPNCGWQLTSGTWETIDVSQYSSLLKHEIRNGKRLYVHNHTNAILSYSIDGEQQSRVQRDGIVEIEIKKATNLEVSIYYASTIIKVYPNDVFENIVIEVNEWGYLQYKTY